MPDKTSQITAVTEPTDVRFSMRSILLATLVIAIAAALIGPELRGIPAEDLGRTALLWGLFFSIVLFQIVRFARKRYRLEKAAGRILVASHWRGTYTGHSWTFGAFLVGGIVISIGISCLVMASQALRSNLVEMLIPVAAATAFAGVCVSNGVVLIWWHRTAQFRENGFLYGLRLLPWSNVANYKLAFCTLKLSGVDTQNANFQLIMNVPTDRVAAVQTLLSEKLPKLKNTLVTAASAPKSGKG